jgi:hypothetical protein
MLEHECKLVQLAAHWADLHHPDSQSPVEKPLPGAEQGRQLGGEGTPEGLEFAAAELGARMETSIGMAKMWEAERFVRAGRTNQSGLKLLIAKANGGDVIWFMATVNRIAEILRLQGDMDSAEVRRSKAIGILAQPALALQLLWEFRNQQQAAPQPQQPDEPIQNEPIAPFDHSTAAPADDVIETAAEETVQAAELKPAGRGLITRPSGVDASKLRPQVMLHIHLSQEALLAFTDDKPGIVGGAARLEGIGPTTLGQVRRFLADTACQVRVQPVIDPEDTPPVDSYEIPRRIREAMFLRMPASCFPYAARTQRMDLDHTKPYLPLGRGGPPGQTGVHGLGPLGRTEHRIKTHSRWRVRQPEPGVWIWRPPHWNYYLVTNAGTQ